MLPQSQRNPLRTRILPWMFVPAVLILVASAVITYIAYERSLEAEIIDRERERAYLAANRLREEMARFSEVLASLARTEAIYPNHPVGQRSALLDARRRLAVFDGGVVLLNSSGKVVGSQPERLEIYGRDWSNRPYFRQLLGGRSVGFSTVVNDGPEGASVIVLAVPITSPRGEFLGALAGMFRLGEPTISAFYASLVRLRAGEGAYLLDSTGEVVYHPNPSLIGQNLSGNPIIERALAGQLGALRISSDEDEVVAFAPVPGTPWTLIAEHDWSAQIAPSRGYQRFLLLLLAVGVVLPGAWFGLLARQRRSEAMERARVEHQLQVARLIQQTLLPGDTPNLSGWRLSGHYEPADAVGGDFYDFLSLDDGQIGLIIGDVTDKGVPAALLMATTRSLLRTIAGQVRDPGEVLQQVNALLSREIPPMMFVTCLYAVLDPATGRLRYANAGHNLPYRAHCGNGDRGVAQLRATGMPLGLMSNSTYEEMETTIASGECLLFYSDGLVEAHNRQREMFGNPRLEDLLCKREAECSSLIQHLLAELDLFTGRGWRHEDDVTLVTLERAGAHTPELMGDGAEPDPGRWRPVIQFDLPSEPGRERQAVRQVERAIDGLGLDPIQMERLKTAVGEATMNAMEHGNQYKPERLVTIQVMTSDEAIKVRVADEGSGLPGPRPPLPDLEAKLAGRQSPRGWGLYLIETMVDKVNDIVEDDGHTLELVMLRKGQYDGQLRA